MQMVQQVNNVSTTFNSVKTFVAVGSDIALLCTNRLILVHLFVTGILQLSIEFSTRSVVASRNKSRFNLGDQLVSLLLRYTALAGIFNSPIIFNLSSADVNSMKYMGAAADWKGCHGWR
jgi:hypothetical protein